MFLVNCRQRHDWIWPYSPRLFFFLWLFRSFQSRKGAVVSTGAVRWWRSPWVVRSLPAHLPVQPVLKETHICVMCLCVCVWVNFSRCCCSFRVSKVRNEDWGFKTASLWCLRWRLSSDWYYFEKYMFLTEFVFVLFHNSPTPTFLQQVIPFVGKWQPVYRLDY